MLTLNSILILAISAGATSVISATVGMAGGTVLLSILLLFLAPSIAIPVHAANQLVSNFWRCRLLRSSIRWNFFYTFCLGAIIGNTASAWLLKTALDLKHGTLFIALIILYTVFKPKKLPSFSPHAKGFFFVGISLGFAGMFLGATGLILGTCFVRNDMQKEEILATQGSMQTFNHFTKILGFLWLGFDYAPWPIPISAMIVASFIGTTYGVSLVRKIPENIFAVMFRGVLVISAIHIIWNWSKETFVL